MNTTYSAFFAGIILLSSVSVVNAAPVVLSDKQLDSVTAGASVSVAAKASAYGLYPASGSSVGTVTANSAAGGYSVAWASGSNGSSASTSGTAIANAIAVNYTYSGTFKTLTYSVTTVAAY